MRSGLLIGAAMAVLSVRLLAGGADSPAPEPAATRAASAAAALLAGAAASAPASGGVPAPHAAGAAAAGGGAARSGMAAGGGTAPSSGRAMEAASVEAEVRMRRARGEDEDAVYRVRAAQLPAADVAQLMAMESAEAAWQRQLASMPDGCAAACVAAAPEHVAVSAYRQEAAPRLTLE